MLLFQKSDVFQESLLCESGNHSEDMLLKQLCLKWTNIGCSLHFQLFKQLWFAVDSVKGAKSFNAITIFWVLCELRNLFWDI